MKLSGFLGRLVNSLISAGLRLQSAALPKLIIKSISFDLTQRRISPEGRACRLALKEKGILKVYNIFTV